MVYINILCERESKIGRRRIWASAPRFRVRRIAHSGTARYYDTACSITAFINASQVIKGKVMGIVVQDAPDAFTMPIRGMKRRATGEHPTNRKKARRHESSVEPGPI